MQNLSPDQIDELHDDIERYLSLETSEVNIDFWTVCGLFLLFLRHLSMFLRI
jgi:hypothetical protein